MLPTWSGAPYDVGATMCEIIHECDRRSADTPPCPDGRCEPPDGSESRHRMADDEVPIQVALGGTWLIDSAAACGLRGRAA
jgi:hypothetical protein